MSVKNCIVIAKDGKVRCYKLSSENKKNNSIIKITINSLKIQDCNDWIVILFIMYWCYKLINKSKMNERFVFDSQWKININAIENYLCRPSRWLKQFQIKYDLHTLIRMYSDQRPLYFCSLLYRLSSKMNSLHLNGGQHRKSWKYIWAFYICLYT